MVRCTRPGCRWQAIAPTPAAGRQQLAEHIVAEHTDSVDEDLPEGKVQVSLDGDEWVTVTFEEARRLHREFHGTGGD